MKRGKRRSPAYHLYIVRCADGTLYTGITVNLKRRVVEHNTSLLGAKYTRTRRPVKLIYAKRFRNRVNASKAEARVKGLSRSQKLSVIKKK